MTYMGCWKYFTSQHNSQNNSLIIPADLCIHSLIVVDIQNPMKDLKHPKYTTFGVSIDRAPASGAEGRVISKPLKMVSIASLLAFSIMRI